MKLRLASGRVGPLLRAAVLLLLGSQALHHLRYVLAPEADTGATLSGHADAWHLLASGPGIAVISATAVAVLVVKAAASPALAAPHDTRVRRLWPLAAAALLVTYGSQELLEGWLGHGHAGGFEALTTSGGWVVLPLAVLLGGAVALCIRVARAADALTLRPDVWFIFPVAVPTALVRTPYGRPARPVLSEHRAGRAPPVAA